jgi:hypothetical protein
MAPPTCGAPRIACEPQPGAAISYDRDAQTSAIIALTKWREF